MWCCTPVIPVLTRLRQENYELETSLGYTKQNKNTAKIKYKKWDKWARCQWQRSGESSFKASPGK
jgi:hypothetical protein